jgi:RNA-directed DNA polymerase
LERGMLRKWLRAGFMEHGAWHPTDEGTPQGGNLSPVLANGALDGLERLLREHFPQCKDGTGAKVNLIRYADDFVITGATREVLEQEVRPLVQAFLAERGLELSPAKTVVTHIDAGFDFLGQNVRKYHGKLLIKPSKASIRAHLAHIRGVIKDHPTYAAGQLIMRLNPIIRGWASYHRHVVSRKIFSSVDHAIFQALWRWARRRHTRKGKRWVQAKYFPTYGSRRWVFSGETIDRRGRARRHTLVRSTDVSIQRHVKIQHGANPYDPAWEAYFERRLAARMEATLAGHQRLRSLWKRQAGRCPRCRQAITRSSGWHSHHVIWKSRGGTDTAANQQLLHPTCHMQVHAAQNSVVTPRPISGAFGKARADCGETRTVSS